MSTTHLVTVMHEDPIFAEGLKAILSEQPEIALTGSARDTESTVADRLPDLVVADLRSGLEWLRSARPTHQRLADKPRVLIVSMRLGENDVRGALIAGALGYVDQACGITELRAAASAAVRGERYLAPNVARSLARSLNYATLTARETDVLDLIASGLCNKRIASSLDIATGTVKAHVSAILEKLRATSRTEAVLLARDRGLIAGSVSNWN